MKKVLATLLTLLTLQVSAQDLGLELFGGASNYQGDLQEKPYTFQGSKIAIGAGLSWALTEHFSVRGMFTYAKITANDKNNKDTFLVLRNLNFTSNIVEFGITGQYHIFNTFNSRVNPYLTAGIAVFHHNPYTLDSSGSKYFLKPLSTEGQGLSQYPDRKPYSLTQIAIPFGAGVKFAVTENISIGWEITLRKTFTDYLDDISRSYVDQTVLLNAKGPKAVELAYRSDELKNGNPVYPRDGTVRGGPEFKDWYYFSGLTATFRLQNPHGKQDGYTGRPAKTACPKPVF